MAVEMGKMGIPFRIERVTTSLYNNLVPSVCLCGCMSVCLSVCMYVCHNVVIHITREPMGGFSKFKRSWSLVQNRAHHLWFF